MKQTLAPFAVCLLIFLALLGCGCMPSYGSAPAAPAGWPYKPANPVAAKPPDPAAGGMTARDNETRRQNREWSRWKMTAQVPILMYHSISNNPRNSLCVSPDMFREQMEYLKEADYTPVTFEDLNRWAELGKLPPKPVLITFDDGYKDNFTNAYPVLKSLGLKATIFVITGYIGSPRSLSWTEIDEMNQSGLVEFGSHTVSHLELDKLSENARHREIWNSRQTLADHFGTPPLAFCYPAGKYNTDVVRDVQSAGYEFAVTTHPGQAQVSQGLLTLERVRIPGTLSLAGFQHLLP